MYIASVNQKLPLYMQYKVFMFCNVCIVVALQLYKYCDILYFAWADQRDKVCFIFHKVQGCCMEKKAVNLFIVFAPQHIPEGDNCIFAYQHYTR